MKKIEIYVNKLQVENEVEACENGLPLLQELVNEFTKAGCKLTAPKLFNFVASATSAGKHPDRTKELVKTVIVENLENVPNIAGLTISTDKLKELIEIPNISAFIDLIESMTNEINILATYARLENDTLTIAPDYKEQIKQNNTVFADSEKQIEAFNTLTALKDTLNESFERLGLKVDGIIDGLEIDGGKYRVNGRFIKHRF